eukprot:662061-Pyramimonas_sp.AAC.1
MIESQCKRNLDKYADGGTDVLPPLFKTRSKPQRRDLLRTATPTSFDPDNTQLLLVQVEVGKQDTITDNIIG